MKIILIVDGKKSDSYEEFKKRIVNLTSELSELESIKKSKIVLTDSRPPTISIIPFRKEKISVISLYSNGDRVPSDALQIANLRGAFVVTEAIPVGYDKNWSDGLATPGINLLTLFRKKQNLEYEEFLDRWHNGHTPLSLKIHPLWNYNRNVVEKSLKDLSVWYDGIVEEQVRNVPELLNPFKFFGSPINIIPNMISVYRDVKGFIDYPSIETYLANEYWIKS